MEHNQPNDLIAVAEAQRLLGVSHAKIAQLIRDGALRHFPDLGVALDRHESPAGAEWRVHFHVPLFTAEFNGLGSTQDYVRQVLDIARRTHFANHFEIETYTWDVLPAGLKIDLLDSIGREYDWVLEQFK